MKDVTFLATLAAIFALIAYGDRPTPVDQPASHTTPQSSWTPEPRPELLPIDLPALPAFATDAQGLVPNGWRLIAVKSGDLNADKKPDIAVLIRMTDPRNVRPVASSPYYRSDDTNPYFLAIGFAERDGYALVASHHALFPREVAPMHADDPPSEDTVKIEEGTLALSFGFLRGGALMRFRWNGSAFSLVGYDCSGVLAGELSSLSANYLTRTAVYERGRIDDSQTEITKVRIRPGSRPILEEIDWDSDMGTDSNGSRLAC